MSHFNIGDKFINPKTGGVAEIIDVQIKVYDTGSWTYNEVLYIMRGHRLDIIQTVHENTLIDWLQGEKLKPFTNTLEPKRYSIKFNFIESLAV